MPHFTLEYSSNIDKETLAAQALFAKLHQTAVNTAAKFPLKGMRSRAFASEIFYIADGNPNHMFVHLLVKIGVGRSLEEREIASKEFFAVLTEHFASSFETRGVAMSFEMMELEPVTKFNKNNVSDYMGNDVGKKL